MRIVDDDRGGSGCGGGSDSVSSGGDGGSHDFDDGAQPIITDNDEEGDPYDIIYPGNYEGLLSAGNDQL